MNKKTIRQAFETLQKAINTENKRALAQLKTRHGGERDRIEANHEAATMIRASQNIASYLGILR